MIHVIATVELHPGQTKAYLDYFQGTLVPLVRGEVGCIEYGPTVDVEHPLPKHPEPRPDVVTIVEKWSSLEALEAHRHAEHMQAYREFVKPFVRHSSVIVLRPA